MFNIIKKHYLVIILALLVGVLTFMPQYLAIINMGEDFKGIYPINNDDEIYYLARARDVTDGHNFLSNPYLYEYKDSDPMQFWLPDYILAKPLSFFDINIEQGFTIYDFILPIILTLLTYAIIFSITKNKILSLTGATWLHLGRFLYFFDRPISPQFIFIFWSLTLFLLIKYIRSKKAAFFASSIIIFGLLFHFYPYFWTFFIVLLLVFMLLGILHTRKFNFKPYFYIILGAVLIGIIYFISLFNSTQNPYYDESIYRLGMIDSHFPSGIKIVVLSSLLLLLWFIFYKKKIISINKTSLLLVSGLIATVVCVNQHVITGKNLEFSSHYLPLSIFWYVISTSYLINKLFISDKFIKNKSKIFVSLFILVFVWSAWQASNLFFKNSKANDWKIDMQRYAVVLDWLDNNTDKESVVYANQDISHLIPLYTADNIFYAREANLFFLPDEEVFERFVINNYYQDFTKDFLIANERSVWGVHYRDEYHHNLSKNKLRKIFFLNPVEYQAIPEYKIEHVLNLAEQIKSDTLENNLFKYKVDYLVFDSKHDIWNEEDLDFTELVINLDDFFIYKINK